MHVHLTLSHYCNIHYIAYQNKQQQQKKTTKHDVLCSVIPPPGALQSPECVAESYTTLMERQRLLAHPLSAEQ